MLTEEIKASIEESVLCWLATVGVDGEPNCSPKEAFLAIDDRHLLIADIASPKSKENILANNKVCVSFVHVFKQKGFKLKGSATYIAHSDHQFETYYAPIKAMIGDRFPVRGVILVSVVTVQPIIAPSYHLFPDITEASKIKTAKRAYGV